MSPVSAVADKLRNCLVAESFELKDLAEEIRLAVGDQVADVLDLSLGARAVSEDLIVVGERRHTESRNSGADATSDFPGVCVAECVPGAFSQQVSDWMEVSTTGTWGTVARTVWTATLGDLWVRATQCV